MCEFIQPKKGKKEGRRILVIISRSYSWFRICGNIMVISVSEAFPPQSSFFGIDNVVKIMFFYAVLYGLYPTRSVFLTAG